VPRAVLYDPSLVSASVPDWIAGADMDRYRFTGSDGRPRVLPLRQPPSFGLARTHWLASRTQVVLAARDNSNALEPLEPVLALAALYQDRWGDHAVGLGELAQRGRCWSLRWSDPRDAWDLLQPLLGEPLHHEPVSACVPRSAMGF
jgi:hypothetical protein